MITVSLCMIVKNEENVLARCLDSIADLCDEVIIVDTGSTDATKEIARRYTEKIYDFTWTGSFADARNFAFSKAKMEYIYSADADEHLDEANRTRFRQLKAALLEEIEIVQMLYVEKGIRTVLNADAEYRPKLYRRNRSFTWIDPVHETVRTLPVVFDSDIEIIHEPETLHAGRDFALIQRAYDKEGMLSANLVNMYVRELYKCADADELAEAVPYLNAILEEGTDDETACKVFCVLMREATMRQDVKNMLKYASRILAGGGCAECCCDLGDYYLSIQDEEEAYLWYYNALHECDSILDVTKEDTYPKEKLDFLTQCKRNG